VATPSEAGPPDTGPPDARHDVLIAGGGPVGASLAVALGRAGVSAAVIDAARRPLEPAALEHPSYDERPIALALGSRHILEGLGAWPALAPVATPIRRIHVSDRGRFGFTRLDAGEQGVEAFGYVTDARALGRALDGAIPSAGAIEWLAPARIDAAGVETREVRLRIAPDGGGSRVLGGRLLVVADGGRSALRALLGIGARERDYGQCALTASVRPERDHRFTAYERFTEEGPLAVLPMDGGRCGVVWTLAPEDARRLARCDERIFLSALADRFGRRLGAFAEPGPRRAYPLALIEARERVRPRVAIIGNAAHTLHPIAGQGLNLGFRDAAALAEVVVDALRGGRDPGSLAVLREYERWRAGDQRRIARLTDGLVWLFSNRFPPLVLGRDLGLLIMDVVPALKRAFAARAMGRAGRQARLARGLPL